MQVFQSNATGAFNTTPTSTPVPSGPHGVVVDSTNTYVYVANFGTPSTISGFSIGSGGTLTALSGSPYPAPAGVTALVRDNSGKYIVALGSDSTNGIQLYSIGSGGVLTSVASAPSGGETIPTFLSIGVTH